MIIPVEAKDRDWVRQFLLEHWGSDFMVSKGKIFRPHEHPGFLAALEGKRVGVVTYQIEGEECEVTLLHSLKPGVGMGTALMEAVIGVARQAGCRRVWLITTNDNLNALGFYQKRGFRLVAVTPNAMEATRRLKPHIPLVGDNNIPLRDEIELEFLLQPAAPPEPSVQSVIRLATENDIEGMIALAAQKRAEYARYAPTFWRPAPDAEEKQTVYFTTLLALPNIFALVSEEAGALNGFLIGTITTAPPVYAPGGQVCLIDDFTVARPEHWATVGAALLAAARQTADQHETALTIAVCAHRDEAKRVMLRSAGLTLVSEWYAHPA